jgi:hypothetical protein
MMIEITFTEMVLLAWAVLATATAFKLRDEARSARRMLIVFIENKDAREQLLKAHDNFMRSQS